MALQRHIAQTTVLVNDYDEAIEFFVAKLDFELVEDSKDPSPHIPEDAKRWVVVAPKGSEAKLLLSRANSAEQKACVGSQSVGRVFLYLYTDDFWRDYRLYKSRGIEFVRGEPREERYGTVAVFLDISGNMWDLIEPAPGN